MDHLKIRKQDVEKARSLSRELACFVQTDVAPLRQFYASEKIDIFLLHGLSHGALFWCSPLYRRNKRQVLFVQLPWYHGGDRLNKAAALVEGLMNHRLQRENVVILANSEDELEQAIAAGFKSSILCNNNCWLDWRLFGVDASVEKKYSLVLNSRPERWKRCHLASGVKNLAVIQGKLYRQDDYFDLWSLSPRYINDKRLSPQEVGRLLQQSYVGGCFSAEEGACYASSEFLLSGLPVVSTASKGGRDLWYRDDNSIIVEIDSEEAVAEATNTLIKRLRRGDINPHRIRSDHIGLQQHFRDQFVNVMQDFLDIAGERVDARIELERQYHNKMTRFVPVVQV